MVNPHPSIPVRASELMEQMSITRSHETRMHMYDAYWYSNAPNLPGGLPSLLNGNHRAYALALAAGLSRVDSGAHFSGSPVD